MAQSYLLLVLNIIIIIIIFISTIIIVIIIIIIISFMQGIYTYIPKTNYVPREYTVAAIMLLLFMVLISLVSVLNLLYFYISTSRSMCAVPNMAVFCSSLLLLLLFCFPCNGLLLSAESEDIISNFLIVAVFVIVDLQTKGTVSFGTAANGIMSW